MVEEFDSHMAVYGEYPITYLMDVVNQFFFSHIKTYSYDRNRFKTCTGAATAAVAHKGNGLIEKEDQSSSRAHQG